MTNKLFANIKKKPYLLLIPFFAIIILYLHFIHATSFGFTDAYNSYVRAYFLNKGRLLYSDIFSHHNMLMVYFSYLVQKFQPDTLYQLVLYHRMAIGVYCALMAGLLMWRFRWVGVGFVFVYELTKYYLFGDLFLAESLVAYLLVYIFGIVWQKVTKQSVSKIDIILSLVFTWLVAFLREPFIPVVVLLSAILIFDKKYVKLKAISILSLIILTFVLISTVVFSDYYFNMITLNFGGYIQDELGSQGVAGAGIVKIFLYPIVILFLGEKTDFHFILIALTGVFLMSVIPLLLKRQFKLAFLLFFSLGLANIRYREPGSEFFSGFHMLPWYALFVFSIFLMLLKETRKVRFAWYKYISLALIGVAVVIAILPPYSTVYNKERQDEFTANYGRFYTYGDAIRLLSNPNDSLFVDDWDTLVYWQSGLDSSYKYAMYFPVMTTVSKFSDAREEMFRRNPPDFYYTDCERKNITQKDAVFIPQYRQKDYVNVLWSGQPSCLYILKKKVPEISQKQWNEVQAQHGFTSPERAF